MSKKYDLIYADPPWHYKAGGNRNAKNHYPVMNTQDICNLKVGDLAKDDSILLIWVTFPNLKDGLKVIEGWGFTYKTIGFNWVKLNKKNGKPFWGLGHYTRANTEVCLIATKGKPRDKLIKSRSVHSVIQTPIRKHSQKPDEAYEAIEKLVGDASKIELFARNTREGWDCWGNEVETEIEL